MKLFQTIGLTSILLLLLSSCQNKALDYNNNLVKIQQGVLPQVQDFAKKWSTNVDSTNLQNIKPEADKIVQLLDQKIGEVNVLPEVENSQDLKNAILDQLKYQKNICYKLGKLGDPQVSADEKEAIAKEFATSSEDADKVTNRVTETQKAFAEKNHFTLEKK